MNDTNAMTLGRPYREKRAAPVRLSNDEKWQVAKYLIEQKLVMIDKQGHFTRFRNFIKDIIEEMNTLEILGKDRQITGEFHLKDSLGFYTEVNRLAGNKITVPVQDSVQEEQLKIELHKKMNECNDLNKRLSALEALYARVVVRLEEDAKYMGMAWKNDYDIVKNGGLKLRP